MYKHTYTSTSERYLLDERIQDKINNGVDKLMKKLEYSLLHNAYPNVNKEKRGTKAAITDFSILLGAYVSDYHIDNDSSLE